GRDVDDAVARNGRRADLAEEGRDVRARHRTAADHGDAVTPDVVGRGVVDVGEQFVGDDVVGLASGDDDVRVLVGQLLQPFRVLRLRRVRAVHAAGEWDGRGDEGRLVAGVGVGRGVD